MAWKALQDDLCPGCGQPRSESMARDADGAYTATPLKCFGCAAQHAASKRSTDPSGWYFALARDDTTRSGL